MARLIQAAVYYSHPDDGYDHRLKIAERIDIISSIKLVYDDYFSKLAATLDILKPEDN